MQKKRLDVLLVEKGYFSSRSRAQAAILEGRVFVNGEKEDKAGRLVSEEAVVEVKGKAIPYVSRGGVKLKKALDAFGVYVKGKVVLDVGAGTGGFTDVLLRACAKKVIAVDVGYGKFDFSLRKNPKVKLLERTNIRYLGPKQLDELADLGVVDLSFISVKKVIDNLKRLVKKRGKLIILFKPQFEVGREKVGKGGVVRKKEIHKEALEDIWRYFTSRGIKVKDLTFSPILGAKGNIEFLFYLDLAEEDKIRESEMKKKVNEVVEEAHYKLFLKS